MEGFVEMVDKFFLYTSKSSGIQNPLQHMILYQIILTGTTVDAPSINAMCLFQEPFSLPAPVLYLDIYKIMTKVKTFCCLSISVWLPVSTLQVSLSPLLPPSLSPVFPFFLSVSFAKETKQSSSPVFLLSL